MKKILWIVIGAAVILVLGRDQLLSFISNRIVFREYVTMRVKSMLGGWAGGEADGSYGEQTACSQWFMGAMIVPSVQQMDWASIHFDRWRKEKNLFRTIKSWEVLNVEVLPDTAPRTAIAKVLIEGKPYTLIVRERLPIAWGDNDRPSHRIEITPAERELCFREDP